MSVFNRKMFRPRNARNALNRSAGIPNVQKFHAGGPVGHTHNSRPNRSGGIFNLPMFNSPSFNAFAKQPTSLRGLLGPEGRRLAGIPESGAATGQTTTTMGNMAGQPDRLSGLTIDDILSGASRMDQRFDQRIADAAAQVPPIQPGPPTSGVTGTATNPDGSRAIPDPSAPGFSAPRQSPSEQTQASDRRLIDKARQIGAAQEAGAFDFSEFYDDQGQLRDQPSRSIPDPDYDPNAGSGVTGTGIRPDGDGLIPDPDAGVKDSGVTTGVVAEGEDPSLSQQTDPAGATAAAVAETVEKIDPDSTTLEEGKGAQSYITGLVEGLVDKGDQDGASDALLTAFGQLDPDDTGKLTTDQRLAKMKETISKFFGRDLEAEKSVDGMNLAMLGFLIAAGDSPNALKNIAQGSVQGIKEIKKTKQARMAREDKLNGLVVSTVLGREDKESDQAFRERLQFNSQKHDLNKFSLQDASVMKRFAADLSFKGWAKDTDVALSLNLKNKDIDMVNAKMKNAMNMQIDRLASNEKIAAAGNSSREAIAEANRDSAEIRTVIGNMEKGWGVALLDGKNRGFEGDKLIDYVVENGNKFAAESLLTGPDSLKRATTTLIPTIMKEQDMTYDQASNSLYNNPAFQSQHAKDIEALNIPLVAITDDDGPTGQKLVVGSLISENTGNPVRSRNVIKGGKFYLEVQSDGSLVRYKKRGGGLDDIKVDADGQPLPGQE